MKKILAVLLSVMMIFGTVAFTSSAASSDAIDTNAIMAGYLPNGLVFDVEENVILVFNFKGGKITSDYVFETTATGFEMRTGISDSLIMVTTDGKTLIKEGDYVGLPFVNEAPGNQVHVGWQVVTAAALDYLDTPAPARYQIKEGSPSIIIFDAVYRQTEPEEDTMSTIMSVLVKVFGAIIGLIVFTGDMEAGQALVAEMLGGIMG